MLRSYPLWTYKNKRWMRKESEFFILREPQVIVTPVRGRYPRALPSLVKLVSESPNEVLAVATFQGEEVIGVEVCTVGGLSSCNAPLRNIFRCAVLGDGDKVIVAHNHPCALAKVSKDDQRRVKQLEEVSRKLNLTFADSIIVGLDGIISNTGQPLEAKMEEKVRPLRWVYPRPPSYLPLTQELMTELIEEALRWAAKDPLLLLEGWLVVCVGSSLTLLGAFLLFGDPAKSKLLKLALQVNAHVVALGKFILKERDEVKEAVKRKVLRLHRKFEPLEVVVSPFVVPLL